MATNKAKDKAQEVEAPMAEQSQAPMATGEFEWRCLTCGKTLSIRPSGALFVQDSTIK